MRRWQVFASVVVLAGSVFTGLALMNGAATADEAGTIEWLTGLDKARAKAKEEQRPLLVVFR